MGHLERPTLNSTRPAGGGPASAVVADFNLDGKPDIAVACQSSIKNMNGLALFYGNGDGTFQPIVTVGLKHAGGRALAAADLDKDGAPDLVFTSWSMDTVGVLLNLR